MKDWMSYRKWLTEPSASITGYENRRQAELLAALLVAEILIAVILLPLWSLADPDFPVPGYMQVAIFCTLGIAYAFSRTQRYRLGSYILIAMFPAVITAVIVYAPNPLNETMLALNFLVVSVLLASILLSAGETFFLSVGFLLYVSAFLSFPEVGLPEIYPYWVYLGTTSTLFVASAAVRGRYIERLHQSEHRYRSLFEQSNDAVFILDLNGIHVQANQRGAEMFGYQPDEMIGLSYRALVVPEHHPLSENILHMIVAGEKIPLYERKFRHRNGTIIPAEVNVDIVKDGAGNPLHIQSIVRDISQHKAAQELLRVQRDFAIALSSTSDLMESLDRLLEMSLQVEGVDSGGAYLVDAATGDLNLVTHHGLSDAFVAQIAHFDAQSPQAQLVMKGDAIHQHYDNILPETKNTPRQQEGLRATSVIPVQHDGRVIAAINYASHTHNHIPRRQSRHTRNDFRADWRRDCTHSGRDGPLREPA
ncbi:MAG: PAS domain S-box protein [Caldilineaceae bacterium]